MEKHFQIVYLLDLYGGLLTEKQQYVMGLFCNEDLTVSEIAQQLSVSRQAASDLLRRTEKILLDYDAKLGLFDRYLKNRAIADRLEGLLQAQEAGDEALAALGELRDNL